MKNTSKTPTADLLRYQTPLIFGHYREEIKALYKQEAEKPEGIELGWLLIQVFYIGVIAGKREERSRRKEKREGRS